MLQHLIICFSLYYLSSGCLWEVKNKRKFQAFSSKSGCCRLREVVAYHRFPNKVILLGNLLTFWKTGRLKEVVPTEGSTVIYTMP